MRLFQFRDTIIHINVSLAGHQIKLSISHMKVSSALFPVSIHLEATYVNFGPHWCRDAPFSNYERLQSEWLIDLPEGKGHDIVYSIFSFFFLCYVKWENMGQYLIEWETGSPVMNWMKGKSSDAPHDSRWRHAELQIHARACIGDDGGHAGRPGCRVWLIWRLIWQRKCLFAAPNEKAQRLFERNP